MASGSGSSQASGSGSIKASGSGSRMLVASIDFGTTYSGWAYSFRHEFESNPIHVSSKMWNSGHNITPKAPTCVLIKPDGKSLEAFGYDAEKIYSDLAGKKPPQHKPYYYYQRFKMMLFGNKSLSRTMEIEEEGGKKLSANTVFALAIKYLKDDMLKSAGQTVMNTLRDQEVEWVLTVPAIWNDAAKQFMREAAIEAGILSENLSIALEPEAASLYCRHLPVDKNVTEERISLGAFKENDTYMVVDAGGGTVDITVHQIAQKGCLREIYRANGGAWGGTKVDEKFLSFMADVVGSTVMCDFRKSHPDDYIDLMSDFEIKKERYALTRT